MPDFSIITCVSRPEVYDRCLLRSINATRGRHDVEIIPIHNEGNPYSASNALNIGIDVARSDNLILVHQDVRLLPGWFDRLRQVTNDMPRDWAVLGSAGIDLQYGRGEIGQWGGAAKRASVAVGQVWDADERLNKEPYWNGSKETTKVHCADECLLVLNKRTGLRFDALFTGFHFYGVDLCLQGRAAGYGIYCGNLPIIHYGQYSASFMGNNKYWVYLRMLYDKWRLRFPELLGTHFHWSHSTHPHEGVVPELTSYININLDDGEGCQVHLRSMGLNKVRLSSDRRQP